MTTSTGLDIAAFLDAEHLSVFERIPPRDLGADDIPGTVATIRAAGAARRAASVVPLPDTVTIEDRVTPAPDGHDVMVRLYRPTRASLPHTRLETASALSSSASSNRAVA